MSKETEQKKKAEVSQEGNRKKKQGDKTTLEYRKAIRKAQKEFNAEMDRLSKSDFGDFRKGVIKHLRGIADSFTNIDKMFVMVVENEAKQRNTMIERIGQVHNVIAKDFRRVAGDIRKIYQRLSAVEGTLLVLSVKVISDKGQPIDYQSKKDLADMLSIDLDKMKDEYWASLREKAPENNLGAKKGGET